MSHSVDAGRVMHTGSHHACAGGETRKVLGVALQYLLQWGRSSPVVKAIVSGLFRRQFDVGSSPVIPQVDLALHPSGVDKIRISLVLGSRQWGSATH